MKYTCIKCDTTLRDEIARKIPLGLKPIVELWLQAVDTCTQLTDTARLCNDCWKMAWDELSEVLENDRLSLTLIGAKIECLNCKKSLDDDICSVSYEMDNLVADKAVIWKRIASKLHKNLKITDKLCIECWQNLSCETHSDSIPTLPPAVLPIEYRGSEELDNSSIITLSEFTRASRSSNRCIFGNQCGKERLRVNTKLRIKLLCQQKIYISTECRICKRHNKARDADLKDIHKNKSFQDFRSKDIEDAFDLLVKGLHIVPWNYSDDMTSPECSP